MIMEPKTRLYDEAGKKVRKPIVQSKPREDVDKEVKLSMRMASYRKQKLDAVALTDMLHASTLVDESKGSAEGGRTAGDDTIFLQSLRLEAEELNKRKLLSAEVEEYEEAARYKREVNKVLAKIAHIEGGPAPTSSRARGASKLINKDWAESSPETTPVSMDSSPALSRTRSPRPVPRGRVSSISSICSPISSIGSTFSRSSSGVGGDNGELSEEEMRMIRESFAKVCARYATTDLSKRAFVSLVKQLCKQSGQKTLPSDKDLDIAFVLADVDKNGTVDLDEFMHMFELVKKGEVRGLAGNNLTNSSPRSKDGLAKKQEKFQLQVSSGAESRKAARERANQGIEEAGDEDRQHIQAEDTLRREGYHGRDMISETLHNASDEWNRRQASGNGNTTKAVKLGNYANTTSNSTHQQDRHLSRVEMELKASKDERDTMSLELEKAKVAYKKRLQGAAVKKFRAVDTDKSGSLDLQEVLAGADLLNLGEEQAREWFEELDVDKSGEVDMEAFLAVYNDRAGTVADDIGRLAKTTESTKNRSQGLNSDNTGAAELAGNNRVHARLQASLELTKAKEEYKKRQQAPAVKKFRAIDTDKSGSLDLQEVLAGASLLDLSEEQAREWFEELDVDKSGDIDMDEFLAVYHERHTTVAQDIGRLAKTTEATKNRYMVMNSDNTGAAELAGNSRVHARLQASLELTKQSAAFKKRQQAPAVKKFRAIDTDKSGSLDLQEVLAGASLLDLSEEQARQWFEELDVDKTGDIDMDEFLAVYHERHTTVAEDIGRLAVTTEASKNRNKAMDSDNTGAAELAGNNRVHARLQASLELTKQSAAFKKRQQAPAVKKFRAIDTDKSGSLDLQEVLAGASLLDLSEEQAREWFEELDVDKSGDIDMDEFLAVYHERHTTVAEDIGRLAVTTEASKNRNKAMDSDNTGAAELAGNNRVHARLQASLELTKQSAAFKKRQQAPVVKKFRAIDTDKSGSLDLQEVLAGASLLDLSEEQAREWFEELDVDKSGDIDMDEFLAVYHERHTTVAEDIGRLAVTTEASKSRNKDNTGSIHARLQASLESTKQSEAFKKRQQAPAIKKFRAIDTDKSGSLDLQEVLAGASLLDLSEEEARAWFEELDVDKSGEVDMEAFLAVHHERTSTVAEDIGRLGKGTAASIAGQREKAGTSI